MPGREPGGRGRYARARREGCPRGRVGSILSILMPIFLSKLAPGPRIRQLSPHTVTKAAMRAELGAERIGNCPEWRQGSGWCGMESQASQAVDWQRCSRNAWFSWHDRTIPLPPPGGPWDRLFFQGRRAVLSDRPQLTNTFLFPKELDTRRDRGHIGAMLSNFTDDSWPGASPCRSCQIPGCLEFDDP